MTARTKKSGVTSVTPETPETITGIDARAGGTHVPPDAEPLFVDPPFRLGGATVLLSADLPTKHDLELTIEITAAINTYGEFSLTLQRHVVSTGPLQTTTLGTIRISLADELPATVQLMRDALDRIPRLLAASLLVAAP